MMFHMKIKYKSISPSINLIKTHQNLFGLVPIWYNLMLPNLPTCLHK